jgi:hypothetical protein
VLFGSVELNGTLGRLFVDARLCAVLFGQEKLRLNLAVPGRNLVYTGGAVAKVLSCNKNGHFNVEFELDHFKGGVMSMTHEVPDESFFGSPGFV